MDAVDKALSGITVSLQRTVAQYAGPQFAQRINKRTVAILGVAVLYYTVQGVWNLLNRSGSAEATKGIKKPKSGLEKAVSQVVDGIKSAVEWPVDYAGQATAERLNKQILIAAGVAAFITGFAAQSVFVCMAVYAAGLVASALTIVPPWPYLNQHPIKWLPPIPEEGEEVALVQKKKQ